MKDGGNLASVDMSYDQAFISAAVQQGKTDAWIGLRRLVLQLRRNLMSSVALCRTHALLFSCRLAATRTHGPTAGRCSSRTGAPGSRPITREKGASACMLLRSSSRAPGTTRPALPPSPTSAKSLKVKLTELRMCFISVTFSHLADAFIQNDRSNQNQQKSNICKCYGKSQLVSTVARFTQPHTHTHTQIDR